MPAKNIIKIYVEKGYYHLYNRGVEKRKIFLDARDYKTFLYLLKAYLSSSPKTPFKKIKTLIAEIKLLAYCLMPNHFHLLVKQTTKDAITKLTRRICTNYAMYFNKRYKRVGSLFQGNYKGVLVETDAQLLHLSRYIHINPNEILRSQSKLIDYPYSSYGDYLGLRKTNWLQPEEILAFFRTAKRKNLKDILSYQSFVEDYVEEPEEVLGNLTLE